MRIGSTASIFDINIFYFSNSFLINGFSNLSSYAILYDDIEKILGEMEIVDAQKRYEVPVDYVSESYTEGGQVKE